MTRLIFFLSLALALSAQAQAAYWFDGAWRCSANGQPAQMSWGPQSTNGAPSPVGLTHTGRLVIANGPTIDLELAAHSASALTMRTKQGNLWFLSQVDGNPKQLEGSMTDAAANRYPLSCWRPGEPAPVKVTRLPPIPERQPTDCPLVSGRIHAGTARRAPANREWCETAIALNKGARVVISATGKWSNVGPPQFGPAGVGAKFPGTIAPSADLGALLGRVGGKVFVIGALYDGPAPASGTLLLSMNDVPGTFNDNEGHVDVTITIVP